MGLAEIQQGQRDQGAEHLHALVQAGIVDNASSDGSADFPRVPMLLGQRMDIQRRRLGGHQVARLRVWNPRLVSGRRIVALAPWLQAKWP